MHSITQTGLAVGKLATANKPTYQRHQPEQTLLYQLVQQHYPAFLEHQAAEGRSLPDYVQQEFTDFLKCGRLEHGFLRVRCESCHHEKLVAFSCKRRGFCPSCGARRMAEAAALLVDEVFPARPIRQWVLTRPVSAALSVCRLSRADGQGSGYRDPCDLHSPGATVWIQQTHGNSQELVGLYGSRVRGPIFSRTDSERVLLFRRRKK